MFFKDVGTAPTAGNLHVYSKAKFIVANFNDRGGKGKSTEVTPHITINMELPAGGSAFAWKAPSNGRVVNARLTVWNGNDNDNSTYYVFDKQAADYSFAAADSIKALHQPFLLIQQPVQDATTGGQIFKSIVTNYGRGPCYMKKDELITFRTNDANKYVTLTFEWIPDYKYQATFSRRLEFSDIAEQNLFTRLFVVPYPMYITSIKFGS